jgi:DNA-binding transcriptional ArsR family regulator
LSADETEIVTDLTGSTALVYWYLLKKGGNSAGVREIMRTLKFSSPSSATYHLEKLINLGLICKDNMGGYQVVKRVKIGWFKDFIIIRRRAIPRQFFYAIAASFYISLFLLFFSRLMSSVTVIALLPGVGGCLLFWYETIMLWRRKPRFP